jgi:hypothetical protein
MRPPSGSNPTLGSDPYVSANEGIWDIAVVSRQVAECQHTPEADIGTYARATSSRGGRPGKGIAKQSIV